MPFDITSMFVFGVHQ